MNYVLRGFFGISVYLCLILTSMFVLLLPPGPSGSGSWWDFPLVLSFAGTSMMGAMFVLTARFQRAAAPFGIDLIDYSAAGSHIYIFSKLLTFDVVEGL